MIEIMVPFYGDPELLFHVIESAQKQTCEDWNLTIVDDCYPGAEIGPAIQAIGDSRISYYRNVVNLGITKNFQKCVSLATGEFVTIIGGDDLLLPNYVEVIAKAAEEHPEVDIIQPGVQAIDDTGAVSHSLVDTVKARIMMPQGGDAVELSGQKAATSLLQGNWLYWPSLSFRRTTIQKFNFRVEFSIIQDLALVIDMICAGAKLLSFPTICFQYRRHEASASVSAALSGERFVGESRYFMLANKLMLAKGWTTAARAARWHWTSRVHALTLVPRAILDGNLAGLGILLKHAFRVTRTQQVKP